MKYTGTPDPERDARRQRVSGAVDIASIAFPPTDPLTFGRMVGTIHALIDRPDELRSALDNLAGQRKSALKEAWGDDFDAKMLLAKAGSSELSLTQDELRKLEAALGYRRLCELLLNVGLLREATFEFLKSKGHVE